MARDLQPTKKDYLNHFFPCTLIDWTRTYNYFHAETLDITQLRNDFIHELDGTYSAYLSSSHLVLYHEARIAIQLKQQLERCNNPLTLITTLQTAITKLPAQLKQAWEQMGKADIDMASKKDSINQFAVLSWAKHPYRRLIQTLHKFEAFAQLYNDMEHIESFNHHLTRNEMHQPRTSWVIFTRHPVISQQDAQLISRQATQNPIERATPTFDLVMKPLSPLQTPDVDGDSRFATSQM